MWGNSLDLKPKSLGNFDQFWMRLIGNITRFEFLKIPYLKQNRKNHYQIRVSFHKFNQKITSWKRYKFLLRKFSDYIKLTEEIVKNLKKITWLLETLNILWIYEKVVLAVQRILTHTITTSYTISNITPLNALFCDFKEVLG